MLLTGTFIRALDEKLRFAIPKQLRDVLKQAESPVMYLAPGTDGSLALYTQSALNTMAAQLGQGSPTSQGVRTFSRLFYAQSQPVEMDRQGRIRVPTELSELAGLGREIVLLGVCDHLEIWDRQRWDAYLAQKQPQYDEIAERAFGPAATAPTLPFAPAPQAAPAQVTSENTNPVLESPPVLENPAAPENPAEQRPPRPR